MVRVRNMATAEAGRIGRPSRTENRSVLLDRAYGILQANPAMSAGELAALAGCSKQLADRAIDKFAKCAASKALVDRMTAIERRIAEVERRLAEVAGMPGGLDAPSRMRLRQMARSA